MDVGDGFYGVGLISSIMLVTGAELIALFILACGSFVRPRSRVYVALVAVLLVVASHCAIASSSTGWWRKVFLGCDPVEDLAWLASGYDHTNDPPVGWLAFNALCQFVVILCIVRWSRASWHSTKVLKQESVMDDS